MYKLINQTNNQEFICEKVVVDGYEYYLGDIITDIETSNVWHTNCDSKFHPYLKFIGNTFYAIEEFKKGNFRKVIATNNHSLDIPQIVDEFEELKKEYFKSWSFGETNPNHFYNVLRDAYKKAKEQYQYTKQDMIEFAEWIQDNFSTTGLSNDYWKNSIQYNSKNITELFENSRPKTIYFK